MTTNTTDAIDETRPAVRHQLGSGYICRPMGDKVGIVTPFLLPDGHNIQLLLRDTPQGAMLYDDDNIDQWFVSNFVDGLTLLDGMGDAVYARAAAAHGVEYRDGALCVAVADEDEDDRRLADAVQRLAQAVAMVCRDAGGQAGGGDAGISSLEKAGTAIR